MMEDLYFCILCGEIRHPEVVESQEILEPDLIIKATFRVLGIRDSFPLLDEESKLLININDFCCRCIERSLILNQLFEQIDALYESVNDIKENLSRYFEKSNNFVVSTAEEDDVGKESKLRSFIFEKMAINSPVLDNTEAGAQEIFIELDDSFAEDFMGGDTGFQDSSVEDAEDITLKIERVVGQDGINDPSTSQTALAIQEEPSKNPKNAFVRVKRLPVEEIEKYTRRKKPGQEIQRCKQRLRSRKENPRKLEREVLEDKFFCPVEDCKTKKSTGYDSELLLECHVAKKHKGLTHPYTCEECGRKFRTPKPYEMHVKTHQGDYPFFCKWCGAGCTNITNLRIHEVKHTGELKHKCEFCPKAYRGHNGLKYHVRMTHTKNKPYFCESCGKTFARMDKLKRHTQAVHQKERPWICDVCGKSFPISNYLYMHKKSVHEGHSFSKARSTKLKNQLENSADADTTGVVPPVTSEDLPGLSHTSVIPT